MKLTMSIDNNRLNYSFSHDEIKCNGSKKLNIQDSIFFHSVLDKLIRVIHSEDNNLKDKE
jgi:hypothetical protein